MWMLLWLGLAVLLILPSGGAASTLKLSDVSSDETPASRLDATLAFSNPVGNELTLSVTNDTTGPKYLINSIYFNATSDVTSLALTRVNSSIDGPIGGWSLNTSVAADGFGVFDFELVDGQGNTTDQIESGETVDFVFSFTGTGVDMTDFVRELSSIPPGETPALAAAKFVSGPRDDSAFGAVIPEPGTLGLLGLGLAGLSARRRTRR